MDGATVEVVEIADYRETRFCVARQIGERNIPLNKSKRAFSLSAN